MKRQRSGRTDNSPSSTLSSPTSLVASCYTSEVALSKLDIAVVYLSSIIIVSGPVWVPSLLYYIYKKWKKSPDGPNATEEEKRKRTFYRNLLIGLLAIIYLGPHRHPKFGEWINARKWRLWKVWLKYLSFEVISEHQTHNHRPWSSKKKSFDPKNDQAILALVPHGIVPFGLGFATFPQDAVEAIGKFRPLVASATRLFPIGRTLMGWMNCVEANKSPIDQALAKGDRIGLCPGGIGEMFENYPKKGRHPDDECVILKERKGFIKLALKHNVPIIPIFNFGSSKLLKRVQSPFLEKLSNMFRISLCFCYGKYGLPIPFRRKLLYVIGQALHPSDLVGDISDASSYIASLDESSDEFNYYVNKMHERFCEEIRYLFEKYKGDYGWAQKSLRIV